MVLREAHRYRALLARLPVVHRTRRASRFALTSIAALSLGACGQVVRSATSDLPQDVTPGAMLRGASLFGTDVVGLPDGLVMTPDATPGSALYDLDPHLESLAGFRAGNAVATALSPDGTTLLVLTSGYNRTFDRAGGKADPGSSEYVFVYDVTAGTPHETQVLSVPNTFGGISFEPAGARFYVSGGSDDVLHMYAADAAHRWHEDGAPIALGHLDARGYGGLGLKVSPYAAGVGVSASGALVVVANHENDSVSVIDARGRRVLGDVTLSPGDGAPGGEFPSAVLIVGDRRAYVTCQRDREVVVVDPATRAVVQRIRVGGQPTKIVASHDDARLYVANANSDTVSVIDTASGKVTGELATASPDGAAYGGLRGARGSNPNALALTADDRRLFVTNGGNNTVAVVDLAEGGVRGEVVGLIPTGFYPNAITLSRDGLHAFVASGKSPTGANRFGPWSDAERARTRPYTPGIGNQFSLQLTHGGLLAFPVPAADVLAKLTRQSIRNNRAVVAPTPAIFDALRGKVKHVIYVISENRSYDQILGDLAGADGDPSLVHWGAKITPNQHALAHGFVALDRFFDSGGVSGDGWQWTVGGHTTDVAEKAIPVEYADRGHHSYDWEGTNRNINVGRATLTERLAWNPSTPPSRDLLPGTADVGGVDGPADGGRGLLWDAAMSAGLSFRNYGCFVDDWRYGLPKGDPARIPPLPHPVDTRTRVAFPTRASLAATTDPYYRGFDMAFADYWREAEWAREFDTYVATGALPSLETIRLPHDHFGRFDSAEDGLTTPDTQMADHDYALGLIVEKVSHSPFWESTIVIALEDDAQNGSDHVDAHRSLVLFAGGHVRRGAVVSTSYTTVSVLRTLELLLGMPPLGQQDGGARPMADVLTTIVDTTPYTAIVPGVLRSSSLPLPAPLVGEIAAAPRGTTERWVAATRGFDFSHEDAVPAEELNRVLGCGLAIPRACTPERSSARPAPSRDDDDD